MGKTEIEGIEDGKEVKRNEQAVKAWKEKLIMDVVKVEVTQCWHDGKFRVLKI